MISISPAGAAIDAVNRRQAKRSPVVCNAAAWQERPPSADNSTFATGTWPLQAWPRTAIGCPVFACTPEQFPPLMAAAIEGRDLGLWLAGQGIVGTAATS